MTIVLRDEFTGTAGTHLTAHTPDVGTGTWQLPASNPYPELDGVLDGSGRAVCQNAYSNNNESSNVFVLALGHGIYAAEAVFSTSSYNRHLGFLCSIAIFCANSHAGYVQLNCTNSNTIAGPPFFELAANNTYTDYTHPVVPAFPWTLRLEIDSIARTAKGYINGTLGPSITLKSNDFHADKANQLQLGWAGADGTDNPFRAESVKLDYVHVDVPDPPEPDPPVYPPGGLHLADTFDGVAATSINDRVVPTQEGVSGVRWISQSGGGFARLNGSGEIDFEPVEFVAASEQP